MPVRSILWNVGLVGEVDQGGVRACVTAAKAHPTESQRDVDILLAPALVAHVVSVYPLEVGSCDAEEVAIRAVVRHELRLATRPDTSAVATCERNERREVAPDAQPA